MIYNMKKLLLVFLFLMPAICFAQPSLNFNEQSYDAGSVSQGEIVKHAFEFTNSGDQELLIQKVSGS